MKAITQLLCDALVILQYITLFFIELLENEINVKSCQIVLFNAFKCVLSSSCPLFYTPKYTNERPNI